PEILAVSEAINKKRCSTNSAEHLMGELCDVQELQKTSSFDRISASILGSTAWLRVNAHIREDEFISDQESHII
ncbi:MAG: hypothetical protein ACKOW8_13155, partial [Flavobacteriales bacterium]